MTDIINIINIEIAELVFIEIANIIDIIMKEKNMNGIPVLNNLNVFNVSVKEEVLKSPVVSNDVLTESVKVYPITTNIIKIDMNTIITNIKSTGRRPFLLLNAILLLCLSYI
jgi:hypothetical protein